MPARGDTTRYGPVAASLHWASAGCVLALLPLGIAAARTTDTARTAALLRAHVPLGLLVLLLTLLRALWRLRDVLPAAPAGQSRWQRIAAFANHNLMYLVLLALGGSGIALMVRSRAAAAIFGRGGAPLPRFADYPPLGAHVALAVVLLALLALHLGAVAFHRLVRGDRLLARMRIGGAADDRR